MRTPRRRAAGLTEGMQSWTLEAIVLDPIPGTGFVILDVFFDGELVWFAEDR